jgi:hypothetical protein
LQKNTLCAFVRLGGLFYGVNSGLENCGASLALAAGRFFRSWRKTISGLIFHLQNQLPEVSRKYFADGFCAVQFWN